MVADGASSGRVLTGHQGGNLNEAVQTHAARKSRIGHLGGLRETRARVPRTEVEPAPGKWWGRWGARGRVVRVTGTIIATRLACPGEHRARSQGAAAHGITMG